MFTPLIVSDGDTWQASKTIMADYGAVLVSSLRTTDYTPISQIMVVPQGPKAVRAQVNKLQSKLSGICGGGGSQRSVTIREVAGGAQFSSNFIATYKQVPVLGLLPLNPACACSLTLAQIACTEPQLCCSSSSSHITAAHNSTT